MIKVNILDESELNKYIIEKYPNVKQDKSIISVSADEIRSFFEDENKSNWFLIEYIGSIDAISEHLSLITYKLFLKYFVEISLPDNGTIEDALNIRAELIMANLYDAEESFLCLKVDSHLSENEICFRILVPKYNYVDVWNKKNSVKRTQRRFKDGNY